MISRVSYPHGFSFQLCNSHNYAIVQFDWLNSLLELSKSQSIHGLVK